MFDAAPSDLFVIRSAGNTAFPEAVSYTHLTLPIRAGLVAAEDLTAAIQTHARRVAVQLSDRSPLLAEAVADGALAIRSAYFDIATGQVTLL